MDDKVTTTAPTPCLACRERLAYLRGVCPRCYSRHKNAVKAGQMTWAALVAAGLVLEPQPVGRVWRRWDISTGAK